jgi:hypothetical protein
MGCDWDVSEGLEAPLRLGDSAPPPEVRGRRVDVDADADVDGGLEETAP